MVLPESPAAIHLNNTINANSLSLVPSDPTHHQLWRDSHTWIDLFIVGNLDNLQSYSKSTAPFIVGHDFIEIALNCNKPPPIERSIESRNLKKVEHESLCLALSYHLLSPDPQAPFLFHTFIATSNTSELVLGPCPTSADTAEQILTHAFTHAIETAAPLCKLILSSQLKTVGKSANQSAHEVPRSRLPTCPCLRRPRQPRPLPRSSRGNRQCPGQCQK